MTKLAINLLPTDFTKERIKDATFYKLQAFGVGIILVLIFLSSLTVALQLLQTQRLKQAQAQVSDASSKVISFQDKQVTLMALKNRLGAIDQYIGVPSLQAELLSLINTLIPSSVMINDLVVNKTGEIALSAIISDNILLDEVMSDLLDTNKNKGKISKVSIESLNRNRDGVYRLSVKIKPK